MLRRFCLLWQLLADFSKAVAQRIDLIRTFRAQCNQERVNNCKLGDGVRIDRLGFLPGGLDLGLFGVGRFLALNLRELCLFFGLLPCPPAEDQDLFGAVVAPGLLLLSAAAVLFGVRPAAVVQQSGPQKEPVKERHSADAAATCAAVFVTWSSPRITWLIFMSRSSTTLGKV